MTNRAEFIAGTNPFHKLPADPHFRSPAVATHPDNLELTFPTVPGKSYAAESSDTLMAAWQRGSLPEVTSDGTPKTLTVPKSAGRFFRVSVTDRSSQGDQVSDWAKLMLGLSPAASIEAQTSFDHNSLASELDSQNVVALSPIDTYATQPPNATTAATDLGVLRITRSGFILVGDVTVPVTKSGTAVEGVDYAPIPSSFVFPEGVNSLDVRITPLHNPASAGLTIYPAANPSGTGLTANYYPGASSSYSSPLNFSDLTPTSYNYTRLNTTSGTAVITYSGFPATPIVEGNSVSLQFSSGNRATAPSSRSPFYQEQPSGWRKGPPKILPRRRIPPRRVSDFDPDLALVFDQITLMFRDYRTLTGGNPVGNNDEMMKSIMGGNPKGATLGPPEGQSVNENGELIDRWGSPYFFHQLAKDRIEIRSAGPDRRMWNDDDLISD